MACCVGYRAITLCDSLSVSEGQLTVCTQKHCIVKAWEASQVCQREYKKTLFLFGASSKFLACLPACAATLLAYILTCV